MSPWWLCVGWPALRLHQVTTGTGVYVSRWAILRLGNHKKYIYIYIYNIYIYIYIYVCMYVYYYTPLPLNLANKQASKQASKQATSKQALLLSVLAIARPHRSGLYSTLAIMEPGWWPCQIQVLSQKLTGGAPRRGRQVGRCPPKTASFVPQNTFFCPKVVPNPAQNEQTKGNGLYTSRAPQLPLDKDLFVAL